MKLFYILADILGKVPGALKALVMVGTLIGLLSAGAALAAGAWFAETRYAKRDEIKPFLIRSLLVQERRVDGLSEKLDCDNAKYPSDVYDGCSELQHWRNTINRKRDNLKRMNFNRWRSPPTKHAANAKADEPYD